MERITMSIDEGLATAFDQLISDRGYTSRSKAMAECPSSSLNVCSSSLVNELML